MKGVSCLYVELKGVPGTLSRLEFKCDASVSIESTEMIGMIDEDMEDKRVKLLVRYRRPKFAADNGGGGGRFRTRFCSIPSNKPFHSLEIPSLPFSFTNNSSS